MGKNIQVRKARKLEAKANSTEASRAVLRLARVSPQKARLVADMIRGLEADEALKRLLYTRKKSAGIFYKLLRSAVANAQVKNPEINVDDLVVKTVFVDQGPSLRRFRPRARGMAYRIAKKTCYMTIVLEERVDTNTEAAASEQGE
jgi:large subunit ribosomal protein L22